MLIEILKTDFGETHPLVACQRLVTRTFPERTRADSVVDLFKLADRAGIRVQMTNNDAFEGVFTWDDQGNEAISLSTRSKGARFRFTLAHEIGHWLIRRYFGSEVSGTRYRSSENTRTTQREEEQVANMLASELLLPLTSVVRIIGHRGISLKVLQLLRQRFQVSQMAALRRVADVVNTTVVYLSVVPTRFNERSSWAVIDDAMYAIPGHGFVIDRDEARLLQRMRFSEVVQGKQLRLGMSGSRGRASANFEVVVHDEPIPNADLLAHSVVFRS